MPPRSRSLNPLVWFRRAESAIWALFAEAEYRLGVVPRGTPLAPRPFDRRLLRTVLIVIPMLVGSLFIEPPLRTRLLLLLFLIVLLVVAGIFAADAIEGAKGGGPSAPPRSAPPRSGASGVSSSSTALPTRVPGTTAAGRPGPGTTPRTTPPKSPPPRSTR